MSDPSIEEESLISQDDIDKLLDASSIEGVNDPPEAGEAVDNDLDELGELSQDDIDSLLGGNPSPDDMDSLMNDLVDGDDDGDSDDDDDDDDMELISQDDIDRLMNPSEDDDQDTDDELISMEDIQDLINIEDDNDEELEIDVSDRPIPVSGSDRDEDDGRLDGASVEDGAIDEDEAVDVTDCLLTQETMDELIRNKMDSDDLLEQDSGDTDVQDTVVLDDGDMSLSEALETDIADDGLDTLLPDLSEDFDQGLETDNSDFLEPDLDGGDDGDVTQNDIDALLQESDDDDFMSDDDILISQDDIDTLLMSTDQEDEDVLGDSFMDEGDLDDLDSEDLLDSADVGDLETEENQVILEGADVNPVNSDDSAPPQRPGKSKKFFKSKLVIAALSALLILGISVPSVYFIFFSKQKEPLPGKNILPLAAQDFEVPVITIEEKTDQVPLRQSGTIVLTDFIILASDQSTQMTYVYADISIDYSDQRAYHEINNNSSFYRDLIYESIQTRLMTGKKNEVTEADLIWGVETSLKKVLPPHYIQKISFKTFRTS